MKLISFLVVLFCCCFVLDDMVFAAKQRGRDDAQRQAPQRHRCRGCQKLMAARSRGDYCSVVCSFRSRVCCTRVPDPIPTPSEREEAPSLPAGRTQRGRGFVPNLEVQEEAAGDKEAELTDTDTEDVSYCYGCHNNQSKCCCLFDCETCYQEHPRNVTCDDFLITMGIEVAKPKKVKSATSSRTVGIGYNPDHAALPILGMAPDVCFGVSVCVIGGCRKPVLNGICPKGHMVYQIPVDDNWREGSSGWASW